MSNIVFRSPHAFNPARIHAAAIYCSDGRWGENFDDFEYDYLKLHRYDRVAIPGGPATLTLRGEEGDVARAHLGLLIEVHQLERVALIQHADCAYYLGKLGVTAEALKARQAADLLLARDAIRNINSKLKIEGYLALRNGEEGQHVDFEEVAL